MKRWMKIVAVLAVLLAALVIALLVLAKVLITPERVKATLLPLAEEKLHRKIDLGEIRASLFSGIEIHGLRVYEQDGVEVFLSTDLARLRYQLLPLLAMKVVVDEVRLEKPSIRIVRFHDGQYNFSDLTETSGKTAGSTSASQGDAEDGTAISLLVSQVAVEDGQLVFFDHILNDKAPHRYEISALQVAAEGVGLTGKIPVSLQCQLNGSPLSVDGHVSLEPLGGTFELALQNLDLVPFKPYFESSLPGKLGGLKLNVKAKLAGSADRVDLQGTLSLADIHLQLDAMPEAPLQNVRIDASYDLLLDPAQERLDLRQLGLDYNGIMVNTRGVVNDPLGKPLLDLAVSIPRLDISQALNAVPSALVGDVRSFDPTGAVIVEARLSGGLDDTAKLLQSATIDLENVQATASGYRPALTGRLLIAGETVTSQDLQVRIGDNTADIGVKVNRIFSTPVRVEADISSERFLLEPLLAGSAGSAAATDQGQGQGTSHPQKGSDEIGPFDLPLHATGTIKITEALWKELTVENFLAQYELKDNVFTLTRMDGQVAGGSFSNTARVNLGRKGLAYSAVLTLQAIQADPLLTAVMPKAAGNLLGAMDLSLTLDGRGTQWQALSRNLSGDGSMLVADGRLISPELVKGLSSFLQLPELNDIAFENFSGQFKIVDGKVNLDSRVLSDLLKLFPKGTIGLDGSLNLGLDTRLSPTLSKRMDSRGSVTNYLTDSDGWTRVPLLLKGNFTSPSFSLDPKGVQEQATQAIGKELGRQLDKLFKQPQPAAPSDGQQADEQPVSPPEDPARKLLQDSLQKLFGN